MRYNTYRKYKTLNGYDDRREKITSVIQYVEKNYQLEWQSYDLIKSVPSADFDQYVKGKVLKFIISPNFMIESIGVYNSINDDLDDKIYDFQFEPNSFLFTINDPDQFDGNEDIRVKLLDSAGTPKTLINATTNTSINQNYIDLITVSFGVSSYAINLNSNVIYIIGKHEDSSNSILLKASDVAHIEIDYVLDSNDTQASVASFPVFIPKFIPVE